MNEKLTTIKAIVYKPDDITQVIIKRTDKSVLEVIHETLFNLLKENPGCEVHFLGWEEKE